MGLLDKSGLTYFWSKLKDLLDDKVDKVDGKGLSTEDYTTEEKTKLGNLPADAEANQNAFTNVKVGDKTISASGKTDTFELIAGSNITFTPDETGKSITITGASGLSSTGSDGIAIENNVIKNTGVRSVKSGTTKGTISVNTNGTEEEIQIAGLGSAAYTESGAYATSDQGTKADNAMPKTGGAFGGDVTLNSDPTENMHAATKQYVDNELLDLSDSIEDRLPEDLTDVMLKSVYDTDGNGIVDKAEALNSSAGSTNIPVYFEDGKPKALAYELNATVPADAKFTDTIYDDSDIYDELDYIRNYMTNLTYKEIAIESFTNNKLTVEKGTTVTEVTLSWKFNRTPETLTLDGEAIEDITSTSKTLTGLSITHDSPSADKSWTLKAVDGIGTEVEKSTSITFLNGVYYGVINNGATIDSAAIIALSKNLQSSKSITFTKTAGEGQYIVFALPASYGTPKFNVGGFDGGFNLNKTFDFTNASGYTESYCVWFSDNMDLGETTVKVS